MWEQYVATAKAEGLSEGLSEGISQGKVEGEIKGRTDMVKSMLINGLDIKLVSSISKMPESEILKIKDSLDI